MFGNPRYPTYLVFLGFGIAALLTGLLMVPFIRLMRHEKLGQQVRADGPERHLQKQGTPTMGGIVLLLGTTIACLVQARMTPNIIVALGTTIATGSLGLLDDIESVAHKRSLGLTPAQKMVGLAVVAVFFCLLAVNWCGVIPTIRFPGGTMIDLGVLTTHLKLGGMVVMVPWLYLVFVFLLLVGMSNAVNLTDGLDGLAAGTVFVVMLALAAVAYSEDERNLAIFAGCVGGACVGFLWHNSYPASIFMGDTGSLALGAALSALAVLTKTEVTSLVMGGLFICEALSVIIQVVSFKATGKRVFLMAPIHHHFEKMGWSETKVVIRFWIISGMFAALGFALYFQLP